MKPVMKVKISIDAAMTLALLLLTMLGSMVSGVIVSRYVFPFQAGFGLTSWAEKLHMLCAYWGFVLMSLHLGMHWNMVLAMMRKHLQPSKIRTWALRIAGYSFAAYGVVTFVRRDVGLYLLLKSHFVFFDYTEPLVRFLLGYLAVMSLFVLAGYWLARALRPKGQ